MERIVLEVDDSVGKIYQQLNEKTKQRINQSVSLMVKKAVNDATVLKYSQLLDGIGAEAVKNGLTPEILDELLNGND